MANFTVSTANKFQGMMVESSSCFALGDTAAKGIQLISQVLAQNIHSIIAQRGSCPTAATYDVAVNPSSPVSSLSLSLDNSAATSGLWYAQAEFTTSDLTPMFIGYNTGSGFTADPPSINMSTTDLYTLIIAIVLSINTLLLIWKTWKAKREPRDPPSVEIQNAGSGMDFTLGCFLAYCCCLCAIPCSYASPSRKFRMGAIVGVGVVCMIAGLAILFSGPTPTCYTCCTYFGMKTSPQGAIDENNYCFRPADVKDNKWVGTCFMDKTYEACWSETTRASFGLSVFFSVSLTVIGSWLCIWMAVWNRKILRVTAIQPMMTIVRPAADGHGQVVYARPIGPPQMVDPEDPSLRYRAALGVPTLFFQVPRLFAGYAGLTQKPSTKSLVCSRDLRNIHRKKELGPLGAADPFTFGLQHSNSYGPRPMSTGGVGTRASPGHPAHLTASATPVVIGQPVFVNLGEGTHHPQQHMEESAPTSASGTVEGTPVASPSHSVSLERTPSHYRDL